MSASEKMKWLDAAMTPRPWYEGKAWKDYDPDFAEIKGEDIMVLAALRNALPQIVAVVRNAEEECEQHSATLTGLRAALTTLDEKLP